MFPRISHNGHSGEPCSPTTGSGCGGADILWGTGSCVIKPHFSVTLFVKHRKDELVPLRDSQRKRGHIDCFCSRLFM